ncbi:MAG: hypothetical protein ACT4P1_01105 [Sporichthyaceae bacterium]
MYSPDPRPGTGSEPIDITTTGPASLLGEGNPAPVRPRRHRARIALVAVGATLVAGTGATALAVATYLSGGGTQPEDVLRSGALAFAKVDLDPSVNQKLALWQLSRKLPADFLTDRDAVNEDTPIKDVLLGALFEDSEVDFEADIAPWLGDRAGVALYPPAPGAEEPQVAVAVQFDDFTAMNAALTRRSAVEPMGWTTRGNYVVISETSAEARALATPDAKAALSTQRDYRDDVAALDGDQVALAWADFGAVLTAFTGLATEEESAEITAAFPGGLPQGRIAVGLHAGKDHLEVVGSAFDTTGMGGYGFAAGTGMAGQLPADSLVAVSAMNVPALWEEQLAAPMPGGMSAGDMLSGLGAGFGLRLPADLRAIFGAETAVALAGLDEAGRPQLAVRSRGSDAARSRELLDVLAQCFGMELTLRETGDGFVVGTDAATIAEVADPARGGTLAQNPSFQRAVPDAERAGFVAYLNIARAVERDLFGDLSAEDRADLAVVDAVGYSNGARPEDGFRLRLTFR